MIKEFDKICKEIVIPFRAKNSTAAEINKLQLDITMIQLVELMNFIGNNGACLQIITNEYNGNILNILVKRSI